MAICYRIMFLCYLHYYTMELQWMLKSTWSETVKDNKEAGMGLTMRNFSQDGNVKTRGLKMD